MGVDWDYSLDNSTEGLLVQAVAARIQALNLPSIASDHVFIRKLAWLSTDVNDKPDTPCVLIIPAPEVCDWTKGTNEKDEPVFAFFVITVLANGRDVTTKGMGLQFKWRELVRKSFQNLSNGRFSELGNDKGFKRGYVESGEKFIEAAKRAQMDAQYYLLRFLFQETRT